MKIAFPSWSLSLLSSNKLVTWCIISLICVVGGSYLVGGYFGLMVVVLLGVAGIMIGRVVSARPNLNNSDQEEMAPSWTDTPQVTPGWDYRPRAVSRRNAAFERGGTGLTDAVNSNFPAPDENPDLWLNFANPSPVNEEATTNATLSDEASAVSMYDQSPIDNGRLAANDGH
jgi:hypothetical protein